MALNKVIYVDGETVITAENLNDIQDAIIALENAPAQGLTEDMKHALLQIARKVAYIDDQGQTYYQDLYDALYPPKTVVLITAVFNQGGTVIYDDTALDDLKQYLTVTAKYDDNTTAILSDSAYTLSGLLEAGTSTVTVAYNGLTTTFTVNVTARPTLSSITAVYTAGQDTPKTIDSTRINAYISENGLWTSSSSSYSVCVPVTVGKQYNLHFSTTDSSLVGTIFRYGFSESNTLEGQGLSGLARSTPQDLSDSTATATGPYLVIQLSAATASDVLSNGYLTLTELARDIYTTDTLDSLKPNLVVTATYSDSSTAIVPSADYTLSGTLAVGTSTITVNYGGKTTTFNVTVSDTELVLWNYTDGLPSNNGFTKTTSGTATETIETNDLRLDVSGGNGSEIRYAYDYTPTSAVLEARFKPTGNNFFYILTLKDAFAIRCQYSNNYKGFYLCDSTAGIASTTKIADMTADTEYTVRIVLDSGYADVYINGSIAASHIDISTCVIYKTFTGIRLVSAGSSPIVSYLYSINMELSGGND